MHHCPCPPSRDRCRHVKDRVYVFGRKFSALLTPTDNSDTVGRSVRPARIQASSFCAYSLVLMNQLIYRDLGLTRMFFIDFDFIFEKRIDSPKTSFFNEGMNIVCTALRIKHSFNPYCLRSLWTITILSTATKWPRIIRFLPGKTLEYKRMNKRLIRDLIYENFRHSTSVEWTKETIFLAPVTPIFIEIFIFKEKMEEYGWI